MLWRWIWLNNFFANYTNDQKRENYTKVLEENIFTIMETSHNSYESIMNMPVSRFNNYLKWKKKLEEEYNKLQSSIDSGNNWTEITPGIPLTFTGTENDEVKYKITALDNSTITALKFKIN